MALIIFKAISTKPNFLFGKLPRYFKENDNGSKVIAGYLDQGRFERYLEIFCAEIDAEVSPYIDELLDITDAEALTGLTRDNPTELLTHLSELFGNPPDIGIGETYSGDEDEYIILIRYIAHILRTKGTVKALKYYLAIYGYEIDTLTESSVSAKIYDNTPTALKYDNSVEYDEGFTFYSGWDLAIQDLPGTLVKSPTQAWLDDYLKLAIQNFISPIWATLGTLTHS